MRITFDRKYLPTSLVYSLDSLKYTPHSKTQLVKAQRIITEHKALKLCGILGRRCGSARCAACSKHQARQYLMRVLAAVEEHPDQIAFSLMLTTRSYAEGNLRQGYKDISALWSAFTHSSWLLKHTEGFARATELTFNPVTRLWNLHLHVIILVDKKRLNVPEKIIGRWISKSHDLDIPASLTAQHSAPVENINSALAYTYKDHATRITITENSSGASLSPGDILNLASQGDAYAAELWEEYESASKGHRAKSSGGTLKAIPLQDYREAQQANRDSKAF